MYVNEIVSILIQGLSLMALFTIADELKKLTT